MLTEINWAKRDDWQKRHHARYEKRVELEGLLCQECSGAGGEVDVILEDGTGPWEPCDWCEGTGYVTRWLRGQWLRYKKDLKCDDE